MNLFLNHSPCHRHRRGHGLAMLLRTQPSSSLLPLSLSLNCPVSCLCACQECVIVANKPFLSLAHVLGLPVCLCLCLSFSLSIFGRLSHLLLLYTFALTVSFRLLSVSPSFFPRLPFHPNLHRLSRPTSFTHHETPRRREWPVRERKGWKRRAPVFQISIRHEGIPAKSRQLQNEIWIRTTMYIVHSWREMKHNSRQIHAVPTHKYPTCEGFAPERLCASVLLECP